MRGSVLCPIYADPNLILESKYALVDVLGEDEAAVIMSKNPAVLTCGAGQHGQLGHGDTASSTSLRLVSGLAGTPVCAVACGARHTLALSVAGHVYAWGAAIFGALGLGEDIGEEVLRPRAVRLPPEAGGSSDSAAAVSVSCGVHHSFALSEAGCVLAWGWGRHGQLGDGAQEGAHAFTPRTVGGLERCRVVAVASGGHHAVVRTADGQCYSWGCGSSGQLGHGGTSSTATPAAVDLPPVRQVACGDRHRFAS